jgi:hypothetical protein
VWAKIDPGPHRLSFGLVGQNLRRGHYDLATHAPRCRVAAAFTELALAI